MDILCFGSATRDLFVQVNPKIPGKNICFLPGTKTEIEKLSFYSGGGGTNAAVGFARLGLKTGIVSILGKDGPAKEITAELVKEKVSTFGLFFDKKTITAQSVILTGFGRDRVVLTYSKPLKNLGEKHIPWKKLRSGWFYISSLHSKPALLKKITGFAHRNKIKVALNPGSIELESGLKTLLPILKKTDILLLNALEALTLTHNASIQKNLFELSRYCGTVVITDGANGCFAQSGEKTFRQKAFAAKLVDATGAGDAFGCAFVAGIAKGKSTGFALKAATANAASVIQFLGTKNVLLNQKQINSAIKKSQTKN